MTHSPILLNDNKHRLLRCLPNNDFIQAKQQHLVPLAVDEIMSASADMPVALVKNKTSGEFVVVAIMGLKENENLYFDKGRFQALYAPRVLQLYPFYLQAGGEAGNKHVGFYEDERLISEQKGERLFTDNGKKTEKLSATIEKLMRHDEQMAQTKGFIQLLTQNKLITQRSVSISLSKDSLAKGSLPEGSLPKDSLPEGSLPKKKKLNLDGIYSLDQNALDALNKDVFLSLKNNGALPIIYALSHSLIQLNRVAKLAQLRHFEQNEHEADS